MFNALVNAITNNQPELLLPVLVALAVSSAINYQLGGRYWAFLYVAMIPFLNWSFGVISEFPVVAPNETFNQGVSLHPMTMVTGLVFVVRDFVQREMGHRVLGAMAIAIAWSFFYAWPVIALASGIAFAVSEAVDWLLFTFTKYRLSTRILISSAAASPVDTTIFLYGADLSKQIYAIQQETGASLADAVSSITGPYAILGLNALSVNVPLADGNSLHVANWVVFVIGKMVGAVIVSSAIRRREDRGEVDPAAA